MHTVPCKVLQVFTMAICLVRLQLVQCKCKEEICPTDLYLKPAPGSMHLPQVLLHQGQGLQPLRPQADQAHPLGVYPEEVMPHLHM